MCEWRLKVALVNMAVDDASHSHGVGEAGRRVRRQGRRDAGHGAYRVWRDRACCEGCVGGVRSTARVAGAAGGAARHGGEPVGPNSRPTGAATASPCMTSTTGCTTLRIVPRRW